MTSLMEKDEGPARIEWQFDPKKPKFIPGFKPGLLGQKAIALSLALPPRPFVNVELYVSLNSESS